MSLVFLLDTNVLSEPTKKQPNANVLEKMRQHRNEFCTASVVWHEMWFGCLRLPESRKREALEHYLENIIQPLISILPYDAESGKWHARERARLSQLGQTPPFADGQIAAIAKVNELILVTRNTPDYQYFSDLYIENWHER